MRVTPPIDRTHMIRAFNKAAAHYETGALIEQAIGNRLLARLDYIKITPHTIVDLGCGTGHYLGKLAAYYPQAQLIGIDLAQDMLKIAAAKSSMNTPIRYRCEDAEQTTLADHSVDLIFSNLLFQWCNIDAIAAECKRLLKPRGLVLFSSLGPDTLCELRRCWAKIDNAVHVNHFIDMHHLGDCFMQAQFLDPVMDCEYLTATFSDIIDLMYSLKTVGAHNVNMGRHEGLTGKGKLHQLSRHYEAYRDETGLLPATYEAIYGQAWQVDFTQQQTTDAAGNVRIPLSRVKKPRARR